MSWLVQPRLVNDPWSDPGVYLDFRFGKRALLFDLGDNTPLSPRELLRVTHAFVSHTHMDHFAGFDRLLRIRLHQPEPLHLVGPPEFIDQVDHRLRSYTWNLLDASSVDFRLTVSEFAGDRLTRSAEFAARDAFRRAEGAAPQLAPGCVLDEDQFTVTAATLDHGLPCLAFALRERARINVWRGALQELGLSVGPWLNEAKRAARRGEPDDTMIAVAENVTVPLGALRAKALRIGPGQTIAYVTDAAFHDRNAEAIIALIRGADQLFIETPFLDADRVIVVAKHHLTAAQAGGLARQAQVKRLVPLHFSARYAAQPDALPREVEAAFAGPA